jgi:hypothetical protein
MLNKAQRLKKWMYATGSSSMFSVQPILAQIYFCAEENIFPAPHVEKLLVRSMRERGWIAATKGWCSGCHFACLVKLWAHAQLPVFHAFLTCGALRVWKCNAYTRGGLFFFRRDQESIDLAASPLSAPLPANHSHKSPAHTYTLSRFSMYIHDVCMRAGWEGRRGLFTFARRRRAAYHILYSHPSAERAPGFGIKHRPLLREGNFTYTESIPAQVNCFCCCCLYP